MEIFIIRGTQLSCKTPFFRNFIFLSVKKKVPSNFLKSIFFCGHFNWFNYSDEFSPLYFAYKTEKFHFSPKKRARTAKVSKPIHSAGKNVRRNMLFGCMMGKCFAVRHLSKLFKAREKTR